MAVRAAGRPACRRQPRPRRAVKWFDSYRDRLQRPAADEHEIEQETREEVRGEEAGGQPHEQGDREALHRAGAKVVEDGGRHHDGQVRVDDRAQRPREAGLDGRAPSDGPTVRSSRTTTGAGSAPARRTMARSRASSMVNWPVMTARPPGMRSLIRGAEYTLPSRMMARCLPTFCSVISPKIRVPTGLNSMATCQLPGELGSACTSALFSSAPVSSVRFWTTYGTLRSTFVCLSIRRW